MTLSRIRMSALCLTLFALLVCTHQTALYAQSTTEGAISGTVVDPSGAAISGAAITLHNDGTNAEIKLLSDATGYFKAPLVPPGKYTVTVTAPGFGAFTATTVPVNVGSVTDLNPALKAGSATESVEVSAEAPTLKLESVDVSSVLTSKEIVDLPLNGGRWSDLALLTPAAVSDSNGFGLISFRGISPLLNNVQIDGADNNQAFFSEERGRTREGYSTSQIAIAEFQVNTGVYSAEYGRAAGGALNAITKSGSNQIHGQAYFQDRDNGWGAFNPFTTITTITEPAGGGSPTIVPGLPFKAKDWRKRWGFGAGGPIIKDKLFWFYAYDQYRRNFPGVAKPASPSAFFNQWADLSITSGPAAGASCTTASKTASGNTTVSAVFKAPAGTTPSVGDNEACTLAQRVYGGNYALAAAHYDQLLYGNAVSSVTGLNTPGLLDDLGITPRTGDEVLNTPKLDWQITPREHASVLFHRLRWDSPGGVQTQTSNNYSIDAFGTDFVKLDYGLAKLDSLISANVSNELRFQFGRELNDEGEQPLSKFTSSYLNNASGNPIQLSINGGSSNNGFTGGMPYYSFRTSYPEEEKVQVSDTGNWTEKSQNIKFGFDYLLNHDLINNLFESNGVYSYTYFSDFFADILNKGAGTCDNSASETGLSTNAKSYACYSSFVQGFGTPKFSLGTQDYGFFVQDDWKILPRLTLNLGVRYDYEHVPPPFPSLLASEVTNYALTANHPNDVNNFGPRFGLSWDPFGNGKTVVHTGYGLYYGRNLNGVILNTYEATGSPNGQFQVSYTPTSTGTPAFPGIVNSTSSFPTPSIDYFARHFQNPQVHEFDLSVQRQVLRDTVATVTYQGSLGRELPNFLNLNLNNTTGVSTAAAPSATPTGMYETTLAVTPGSDGKCGPLACGTTIVSDVYARSAKSSTGTTTNTYLNTPYSAVTEVVSNINSNYHALIVEVQNRGNRYAQFDVNYTWSHALDFNQNQSTSPSANNWYDPWSNPRANYGNSNFNVPNRLVAWAMVTNPGTVKGILGYLLNDWHANPIVQWQNGLPYSAGISGSQPTTTLGNYTYTAASSGMTGSGASSFLLQLGRNTFRYPDTLVVDLRLQKDIKVGQKLRVELFGEAFNLLNHLNVTGVSTTGYSITKNATTGVYSLVYQSLFNTGANAGVNAKGFGAVTNADSNFVYSQRQVQLGVKLDF